MGPDSIAGLRDIRVRRGERRGRGGKDDERGEKGKGRKWEGPALYANSAPVIDTLN